MSIIDRTLDKIFDNTDNVVKIKNAFDPPSNPSRTPRVERNNETMQAGFTSNKILLTVAGAAVVGYFLTRKGRN